MIWQVRSKFTKVDEDASVYELGQGEVLPGRVCDL